MRSMKTKSYILVTPAKNEEKNLPLLAKSIINQSIQPRLWVIVNDNSTDATGEIISELESQYEWILGLNMKDNFRGYDATMRYSEVIRAGFDMIINAGISRNVPYGYIGIVDADFILERRFFEKLILEFHRNHEFGILSGGVYLKDKSGRKIYWEKTSPNYPRGSPRLFRRECFDDIGGYLHFYTPDVVSNYLAIIHGWRVGQIVNAIAVQLRPTQSRNGFFESYIRQGRANYHLGVTPLSLLFRTVYMALFDNPSKAAGLLKGYFQEYANNSDYMLPNRIREFAKRDMSVISNIKKVLNLRDF